MSEAAPRLRRTLSLWDLILYGIILIMPIAPVPLFGVAQKVSHGHALLTILAAMVAMMLTAFSYGRMASVYPSAGSAYTYVGRGINAHLGFLAGWAMFLDYLLVPLICTIYGALTMGRLLPEVPYPIWAAVFAGGMTWVNLRGIRATGRANLILLVAMSAVVLAFGAAAIHFLLHRFGVGGLFSMKALWNPATFQPRAVAEGIGIAALTYGGFDGVTTLAEDARNPRRDVIRATVLVCLFTGIFGGLQIYLAQLVWPDYHTFPNIETAFLDVTRLVGGAVLFQAMAAILLLANFGSGMTAQAGLARLLFSMGRDRVLPPGVFAYLDAKRNTPSRNLWFVGGLAFLGALALNYERAAELINFGALLAFMGVNAAAMRVFWFDRQRRRGFLADALAPALGFVFCLFIWISLGGAAKLTGGIWLLAGIIYSAVRTRGFRVMPAPLDFETM